MAHRKAGGTAKNLRDSQPKYLGVKVPDGGAVKAGGIIVRQRGTKIEAGLNVRTGKDHTLFADVSGVVKFREKRKTRYNGQVIKKKVVDVLSEEKPKKTSKKKEKKQAKKSAQKEAKKEVVKKETNKETKTKKTEKTKTTKKSK